MDLPIRTPLVRYITRIHGINLKNCLRIYGDRGTSGYWIVVADAEWNETKVYLPYKDMAKSEQKLIAFACMYNSAMREFILNNTEGVFHGNEGSK